MIRSTSSMNPNTQPSEKRPTFITLPAEIRSRIFTAFLLSRTKTEQGEDTRLQCIESVVRVFGHPSNASKLKSDLLHSRKPLRDCSYTPYSIHAIYDQGDPHFKSYVTNLLHHEPAIWQINRQLREEVRWLYITRHTTIDVRGVDSLYWRRRWPIILNDGLDFAFMWARQELDEKHRKGITRLTVRDWVRVLSSEAYAKISEDSSINEHEFDCNRNMAMLISSPDQEASGVQQESGPMSFPKLASIFQFCLTNNGKTLSVWTPLQLVHKQAQALQKFLDDAVAIPGIAAFDGDTILKCLYFIRTSMTLDVWGETVQRSDTGEIMSVRFAMVATSGEASFGEHKILNDEFKYVAARTSVVEQLAWV